MKKILGILGSITLVSVSLSSTVSCKYDIEATNSVAFASDDWRDGAFRQNIYDGVREAEPNARWITTPDNSTATYEKSYKTFFAYGTNTVIAAGADQRTAVENISNQFKNKKYILVDENIDGFDERTNTTGIFYEVQKAGFLVGYLVGVYANDSVNSERYGNQNEILISGWGGADYQGVNNYLTGFRQGATFYNKTHKDEDNIKKLRFVLYSDTQKNANYSGGWSPGANNARDRAIAQGLIKEKKVDFILPVAASQIQTAISVSKQDNGGRTKVIGVDADQRNVYPTNKDLIFTSIIKNSKLTVSQAVNAANNSDQTEWEENFGGKTYMANIINRGTDYVKDGLEHYEKLDEVLKAIQESENAQEQDVENWDWTNNNLKAWNWKE